MEEESSEKSPPCFILLRITFGKGGHAMDIELTTIIV